MKKSLLAFAIRTAQKTGKVLMKHFKETDPKTRATAKEAKSIFDTIADTIIKHSIEKNFPKHSYLTEETGFVNKHSEYLWVIDPVDGTRNFMNGNPFFAVSIALWKKGKPLLGVIEAPALQERYFSEHGKGAFLITNRLRKRIHTSSGKKLSTAYLVYCEGGTKNKQKMTKIFDKFNPQVKDFRKLGSAALELAWVAGGRADAYLTPEISLWDIAAGILLVKEAGGKLFDFRGKPYRWKGFLKHDRIDLVATNGKLKIIL